MLLTAAASVAAFSVATSTVARATSHPPALRTTPAPPPACPTAIAGPVTAASGLPATRPFTAGAATI